ncbi:MAG: hypothetical protein KTR27_09660 [Leptolyngbyaceae cyanobacterium MAG.088]|nr:hypothetical protein [Leptolyngbyaceae cyanobacterium MAG.088]
MARSERIFLALTLDIYFIKGDFQRSVDLAQQGINLISIPEKSNSSKPKINSTIFSLYQALGKGYLGLKEYDDALQAIGKGLKPITTFQKDLDETLKKVEEVFKDSQDNAEKLKSQVISAKSLLEIYRQSLLTDQGNVYDQMGNQIQAIAVYREVLSLDGAAVLESV